MAVDPERVFPTPRLGARENLTPEEAVAVIDGVAACAVGSELDVQMQRALTIVAHILKSEGGWELADRLHGVLLAAVTPKFIEMARATPSGGARRARYQLAHHFLWQVLQMPVDSAEAAARCVEWTPVLEGLELAAAAADA